MLLVVKLLEIISTRFNFSRRISIAVPNRHSVVANYYYYHHHRRLDRLDDVVSSIVFPVFVVPVHRDLSVSFNFLNYKTPTSSSSRSAFERTKEFKEFNFRLNDTNSTVLLL